MDEIDYLVKKLKLEKLWTADYLAQIYHSSINIPQKDLPKEFDGDRLMLNWAYYLIPEDCICPMHLMYADESWQICAGGPLELWIIEGKNTLKKVIIGSDFKQDQSFIHIVPNGKWFAATPCKGSKFTLITHCVSPAFADQDWIKGYYEEMIQLIPEFPDIAKKFSWPR